MTPEKLANHDFSDVSVVVLSFNRLDELRENLPDLYAAVETAGLEVIVVDNASTDGSQDHLASLASSSRIRLVQNATNLGVAEGRNSGWRLCTRPYILSVDDDSHLTLGSVAVLAQHLRQSPELGLVYPRVVDYTTGRDLVPPRPPTGHLANFHGACHLVRRAAYLDVGDSDEKCAFGAEELDYSIRLRRHGWEIDQVPHVRVKHNGRVGDDAQGRRRRRLWLEGYVRVLYKHFPLNVAVPFSLRIVASHLYSGVHVHGGSFLPHLLISAVRGGYSGRKVYTRAPEGVVRFYKNPQLRPDLGNIRLWRKLRDRALPR